MENQERQQSITDRLIQLSTEYEDLSAMRVICDYVKLQQQTNYKVDNETLFGELVYMYERDRTDKREK